MKVCVTVSAILLVLLTWCFPSFSYAQGKDEVISAEGEYVYNAPETVSLEQAKHTAIERARIQVLADHFGTNIRQSNTTVVKNSNEHSSVQFQSLSQSEVKGEWLMDTKTPTIEVLGYQDNSLVIKAKVWGKIRSNEWSFQTLYDVKVLRNGVEQKFEGTRFKNGDDMYLYVKIPVAGTMAVYLDDEQNSVFCLLPYARNTSGKHVLTQGEHILFSRFQTSPEKRAEVDEYKMTTEKAIEYNTLYVVFSPDEGLVKAADKVAGNVELPRMLSRDEFLNWLGNNRIKDRHLSVKTIGISIEK
jgi:hypothetical protein